MQSDDPDFETKAADVIGLYVNPPDHAAVFAVDEKTAIQALDRLDPVLPLSPGRAERHGFEYYRHGTLSLLAALDKSSSGSRRSSATSWRGGSSRPSRTWLGRFVGISGTTTKPRNRFAGTTATQRIALVVVLQ
jgi:hypothetical protein